MSVNFDKLTNKLDEINTRIIYIMIQYNKLMMEYENNNKNFTIPKVGQKRKRWQST